MTTHITPRDWEALSAYLDGQLAPKERQLLEARLHARADLREALEDLRRTRGVLRARLPVRAPRNFTLTPEMAGIRQKARPGLSLFPAMRLASFVSTFLFVLVAVGELFFSSRLGAPSIMVAEQRQVAAVQTEAPAVEAPPAAPEVALEAPAPESAQPTAQALAKAGGATSPTPLAELAQPIPMITESVPSLGQPGVGGAGGGEDSADQAALSQMAAAATATPLPSPTLTPSATPEPPTEQYADQNVAQEGETSALANRALWRWIELILAVVGVSTGLIAFYMYRVGRS
jgi:anti-sigma factor RsiW